MGGGASKPEDAEAAKRSKNISAKLKKDQKVNSNVLTLLLLGTGNCGKSTFLKQFRMKYGKDGIGNPLEYKKTVSLNIIRALRKAVEVYISQHSAQELHPKTYEMYQLIQENQGLDFWGTVTTASGESLYISKICKTIWSDQAIQNVVKAASDVIEEPVQYFMEKFDQVSQATYIPSEDDVLRVRQRTIGARAYNVTFEGSELRLVDVGGQKSERRKWASHFDNVTAIMYIVSLGEFDCNMLEDPSVNRMRDSLETFESVVKNKFFEKTNIILILNKKDVFFNKIQKENGDLRMAFPDFKGQTGVYREAVDFVREKFMKVFDESKAHLAEHERPSIQMYQTIGTDPKNVQTVFKSCKTIFFDQVVGKI